MTSPKSSYCSSAIMLTVNNLFIILRLRNYSYSLLINALHDFNLPCVRQIRVITVVPSRGPARKDIFQYIIQNTISKSH